MQCSDAVNTSFLPRDEASTAPRPKSPGRHTSETEETMGRGILLWLLGVPIPVIIILALLWH